MARRKRTIVYVSPPDPTLPLVDSEAIQVIQVGEFDRYARTDSGRRMLIQTEVFDWAPQVPFPLFTVRLASGSSNQLASAYFEDGAQLVVRRDLVDLQWLVETLCEVVELP
ncbi:hypothetical protein EON82_08925 [bacterium]|nr:MAG: hypothetical protein EON82_08925 [bacterium]